MASNWVLFLPIMISLRPVIITISPIKIMNNLLYKNNMIIITIITNIISISITEIIMISTIIIPTPTTTLQEQLLLLVQLVHLRTCFRGIHFITTHIVEYKQLSDFTWWEKDCACINLCLSSSSSSSSSHSSLQLS